MVLHRSWRHLVVISSIILLLAQSVTAEIEDNGTCLITSKTRDIMMQYYRSLGDQYLYCEGLRNREDFQNAHTKECSHVYTYRPNCNGTDELKITSSVLETPPWIYIQENFPVLTQLRFENAALNNIGQGVLPSHESLRALWFSNNSLSSIRNASEVLRSLPKLTEFHIEHNPLESFTLSNISNLLNLYLNDNSLRKVNITDMDELTRLDLSGNHLTFALKLQDLKLPSLVYLNLSRNQLENFDVELIFGKGPLEFFELDLSHNKLTTLNCDSMRSNHIYLDHNSLTSLPPGLCLRNGYWNKFSASHNNLTDLPADLLPQKYIGEMWIDFSHNSIREIKPEMFRIHGGDTSTGPEIATIIISNNDLREINLTIFHHTRTRILNISHNHLQELNISQLTFDIDARHNRIEKLLYSVYTTSINEDVISVRLDHNRIHQLSPGMFHIFPKLVELTLSHNKITGLPHGVFAGLKSLVSLDLSCNQLTVVHPAVFMPLGKLQMLWLAGNLLKELDLVKIAKHLPAAKTLDIDHNRWSCEVLYGIISMYKTEVKRYSRIDLSRDLRRNVHLHNVDGVTCLEFPEAPGGAISSVQSVPTPLRTDVPDSANQAAAPSDVVSEEELLRRWRMMYDSENSKIDDLVASEKGLTAGVVMVIVLLTCLCLLSVYGMYRMRQRERINNRLSIDTVMEEL